MWDDEKVLKIDTGDGCTTMCFFHSSSLTTSKDQLLGASTLCRRSTPITLRYRALTVPTGEIALEMGRGLRFPQPMQMCK